MAALPGVLVSGTARAVRSHGLAVRDVLGAGYFRPPATVGRLEPGHAVFLTVVAKR